MEQYFEILGIDPTKDENRIKKAYRNLLRKANPEDDAEGFKRLREAYEHALGYARGSIHETSRDSIGSFIEACETLYSSFFERIKTDNWERLFREAEEFDLDHEEELRYRFLSFIMSHFHLPFSVWKGIDRVFRVTGCREELIERLPEAYVDYLQQAVIYEGSLNYNLFQERPRHDPNQFDQIVDQYIEDYQKLRQFTDMGMEDQGMEIYEKMKDSLVYHPYTELERARLLLMRKQDIKAGAILEHLAGKYPAEERIVCCYAQYLGLLDRWKEAEKVYKSLLALYPESFSVKEGIAEVLLHQGCYRDSREMTLDLLETSPQDERLMKNLNEANVYMIRELAPKYQAGDLDQDGLMDLSWCYYQNMQLTDGLAVMDSFKPDAEHELDYHNLKGRIYLTQENDRQALKHLIPWLTAIKELKDDGTKKTRRRIARLGYAYYTIGAAISGIALSDDNHESSGDESGKPGTYIGECRSETVKNREDALSDAMSYFHKAIEYEKDPSQVTSYRHTVADIFRQIKDHKRVLQECEVLLSENPQYYPGILLRQEAFLQLGMYQQCADDFMRAVSLYPYHGKPYATMMKMYFLFGDYKNAHEVLKQAEAYNPDSDDLSVMKARLIAVTARSKEDLSRALDILDERKERGWNYQSDLDQEEWLEIQFRRGLILTDLGRLKEARAAFEEALTKREDSGLTYSYGTVLMQLEDYQRAIEYFEKTLKMTPGDITVLYRLGLCYKEIGDYEYAVSLLRSVLLRNPDHSMVRMALTEIYERMARAREDNSFYEIALPLMEEQLSRFPDAYHYIEMGLLYLDMDRYQDAFSHFLKSVEQDPDNLYAWNNAGICCLALEKPEESIPYFEQAVRLTEKEKSALPYNNLARAWRMLGRYDEAMECYQKNLDLFPENDDIWLAMMDCLREQEKYCEAIDVCRNGLEKAAISNTLECALLRLYGEMNDREQFIRYGEKLLIKYPDNPVLLQLIGETWLYGFSEYDYAIDYIKQALALLDSDRDRTPESRECQRGCWYLYGRALLAMKQTEEARQAFLRYLSECRGDAIEKDKYENFFGESRRRTFRMGCAWWFLGRYDKAGEYFARVDAYPCRCDGCCRPVCCCSRFGQAMMLYTMKKKAVTLYRQAQKMIPNDMEHRFELRIMQEELF